jgi:trehalose/maltose hydrolase-like predicted phosphorylase
VKQLLRQDMNNQIWETISSELAVKPDYDSESIKEELDLDDDEITVTITTKKGKKIEFTKKIDIELPTDEELREWDDTHDEKFISRMRHPPADEVGGNSGVPYGWR